MYDCTIFERNGAKISASERTTNMERTCDSQVVLVDEPAREYLFGKDVLQGLTVAAQRLSNREPWLWDEASIFDGHQLVRIDRPLSRAFWISERHGRKRRSLAIEGMVLQMLGFRPVRERWFHNPAAHFRFSIVQPKRQYQQRLLIEVFDLLPFWCL